MFATFYASEPTSPATTFISSGPADLQPSQGGDSATPGGGAGVGAGTGSSSATGSGGAGNTTTQPGVLRPKRSQVARACDWCRIHRIKCDTNQPCRNCEARGGQCSNSGKMGEVRTLPRAIREIESLRLRVKDLEAQLEATKGPSDAAESTTRSPSRSQTPSSVSGSWEVPALLGMHSGGATSSASPNIHLHAGGFGTPQFYGPSSTNYFVDRITSYLKSVVPQPFLQPMLENGTGPDVEQPQFSQQQHYRSPMSGRNLTGAQEVYFLDLYWRSWHTIHPVLDEADFRAHYKSLWAGSHSTDARLPSALVDIVLALCMQFSVASTPRDTSFETSSPEPASSAGRFLHHRAQDILATSLESPSLATLQSQFLSAVYLANASYLTTAHATLASAVRTAHALGLHLDPPTTLPRPQAELHRRAWWCLFALDTRLSIRLGRPCATHLAQTTCALPSDDPSLESVTADSTSRPSRLLYTCTRDAAPAERAARHGVAATHILQQAGGGPLDMGWSEPVLLAWNAAVTLAGYIAAYGSDGSVGGGARAAVWRAIEVLEGFGAGEAAAAVRELVGRADIVAVGGSVDPGLGAQFGGFGTGFGEAGDGYHRKAADGSSDGIRPTRLSQSPTAK
ncbi:fungal specific transcription factor domain-containing protein [Verticillium alfalfae VaMs.102]|uniref:Fungal specific transcription factor domain-containing protein n=1 Tax=Verticillium alfalfae (strain VaMs.102 / ATCC MYA-4576 / FGSC 10136) TaxID=526221 RepID=C9SNX2_VERA1|nr:fungal specific transcription factor domain-containing protein [Verticillium alfalfae VaMs.102]EEY20487.1 fungal specific transcription factor domain-containing protein [Verticillium alfalfae VaMs.102]